MTTERVAIPIHWQVFVRIQQLLNFPSRIEFLRGSVKSGIANDLIATGRKKYPTAPKHPVPLFLCSSVPLFLCSSVPSMRNSRETQLMRYLQFFRTLQVNWLSSRIR